MHMAQWKNRFKLLDYSFKTSHEVELHATIVGASINIDFACKSSVVSLTEYNERENGI